VGGGGPAEDDGPAILGVKEGQLTPPWPRGRCGVRRVRGVAAAERPRRRIGKADSKHDSATQHFESRLSNYGLRELHGSPLCLSPDAMPVTRECIGGGSRELRGKRSFFAAGTTGPPFLHVLRCYETEENCALRRF